MDSPNSNLIVNYIPQDLDEEQLKQLFAPYGNIENAKIIKEKMTHRSLGYGFVKFTNDAEAASAIAALNGRQIENKTLKVAVAKAPGSEKLGNLYVAGLELHLTKDDLYTIFRSYGNVVEAKILHDRTTGSSRGIGFVKYDSPAEADAAIKALNGVTLAGTTKPLTVRVAEKKDDKNNMPMGMANFGRNARFNPMGYYPGYQMQGGYGGYQMPPQQPMNPNMPTFCLFVFNLPPESDENYLYQLFGPYGAVAQVKIVRDPATNLCKGFGFVNMVKMEDAQSAIAALNGAQIGTKTLQVSWKKDK